MTQRLTYPLSGHPIVTPNTMQDWVPIDGEWHSIAYVWGKDRMDPDLYVDGVAIPSGRWGIVRSRALSFDEIRTLYEAGPE